MKQISAFYGRMKGCLGKAPLFVCYLDGLGYGMYQNACKQGYLPFISSHFQVEPMLTVTPPITNPAMATMLTGVLPEVHGIKSRKDRILHSETIFAGLKECEVAFLEGDTVIIKTEIRPILHTAAQGRGCDYWIAKDCHQAICEEVPFIFAHFHEIDDCAHTYGPYSVQTLQQLKEIDIVIGRLSEVFEGTFLLVSDHGLHEDGQGQGTHGDGCQEDYVAVWGERI